MQINDPNNTCGVLITATHWDKTKNRNNGNANDKQLAPTIVTEIHLNYGVCGGKKASEGEGRCPASSEKHFFF